MGGGHTVAAFDAELRELHRTIDEMARLAEAQFADAVKAVVRHDTDLAAALVGRDADIDRLEQRAEGQALRMLALRQPMAGDLREVLSAFKIAGSLERIGDAAASIGKRAVTITSLPAVPPVPSLQWMGESVREMIHDVAEAFRTRDADKALAVRGRDGEVDHAYTALFRELLTYMMESPQQITACTHLLFVAKSVERAGDHVTNIAEQVCFLVRGRQQLDERVKEDLSSTTVVTAGREPEGG